MLDIHHNPIGTKNVTTVAQDNESSTAVNSVTNYSQM